MTLDLLIEILTEYRNEIPGLGQKTVTIHRSNGKGKARSHTFSSAGITRDEKTDELVPYISTDSYKGSKL